MKNYAVGLPALSVERLFPKTAKVHEEKDFSFYYVAEGKLLVSYLSEDALYFPGDCFLLPEGRSCSFLPEQGTMVLKVSVDPVFVSSLFEAPSLLLCDSVRNPCWDYRPLSALLLRIASEYPPASRSSALLLASQVYQLLSLAISVPSSSPAPRGSQSGDRMLEIAEYIDVHYGEALTLSGLAGTFYLSPQYLSAFFRKHFGLSFKQYLDEKRLFHAVRDLRTLSLPLHEIALNNGFPSLSAFRRSFKKKYGVSPSAFREDHRQDRFPGTDKGPGHPENSQDAPDPEQLPFVLPVTVPISLKSLKPGIRKPAETVVNIGSVHNLLSESYRARLLDCCREQNISCVRLMELCSNSFVPMTLPDYDYYFQNLDIALSFLYKYSLTPLVELSRLPFCFPFLSEERKSFCYIHRNSRYFRLLRGILGHISHRFPRDWLAKWRFEFCMSPVDSERTYLQDLERIRNLIGTYLPGAQLGGPGYDPCSTPVSLPELLSALKESGMQLDFFSLYLNYHEKDSLSGDTAAYRISKDPDHLKKSCEEARKALLRFFPKLPLYVTEWTSAYDHGLPLADSRYQAAFYTRTRLMLDSCSSLSAYWLFADESRQDQYARKGILSEQYDMADRFGRPNACYYAYLLCSRLGTEVLSEGPDHAFIRKSEGLYQLIAWNYAHFAPAENLKAWEAWDFDRVYELFEEVPALSCRFILSGLSEGSYQIRRTLLDEYHGSILDVLIGEYRHSSLDRKDFFRQAVLPPVNRLSFRNAACVPYERIIYARVQKELLLESVLQPHDVCLWEIRKQA